MEPTPPEPPAMKPPIVAVPQVEGACAVPARNARALRRVEVCQHGSRVRTITRPGWIAFTAFMFGEVQDDAAGQRHGLPVIAGAGAARRDRHVVGVAGLQDLDHLGLGRRARPRNRR